MGTQSWSTRVRHDSDATFREWGLELQTKILATGGVTADETNINWATVVRPGINTEAGYEVYHLNDSLHATAPVYIRIGYGTNTGTTNPRIQVTVGTSTNGSGVLGGTALTTIRSIHSSASQVVDTPRQSYLCAASGFFGLNWKTGASTTEALFIICRTCDTSGAITATGAMVIWGAGGASNITTQALRFAATALAFTANTVTTAAMLGFFPQIPTNTTIGADIQAALGWTITPAMSPLFGVCGVLDSEVTAGNTFSVAMVGSAARTYIALTVNAGPFGPLSALTAGYPKYAMLWE